MSTEKRAVLWLTLAHFTNDFFSGMIGILLAAQDDVIGLSNAQIGTASAIFLSVSIVQPLLGWSADRYNIPHLMILGPSLTAIGLAIIAIAPSFGMIVLGTLLGGFGNAMFHPVGLASARAFGGSAGKGRSVARFMIGGNGGYAISPFIAGFSLSAFGPTGALPFVLLNLMIVPVTYLRLKDSLRTALDNPPTKTEKLPLAETQSPLTRRWYQGTAVLISIYLLIVLMRGVIFQALNTFLPTFYKDSGRDLDFAGVATSALFLCAAFGGFIGSSLSDRLPRLPIVAVSLFLIGPLGWLLLSADGIWILALSVPLGLVMGANWPILLMIGQEVLPGGKSGSSGLAFGWGFVANAGGTFVVGNLADIFGLKETLQLAAIVPVLGALLVFLLPAHSPLEEEEAPLVPNTPMEAKATP